MTDQTPTNTLTDEPAIDFIKRLINAWDCCGTCAGGVLAERDRRILAAREAHTNTPDAAPAPTSVTSVEPGCTCGGIAACQQCQERDAAPAPANRERETVIDPPVPPWCIVHERYNCASAHDITVVLAALRAADVRYHALVSTSYLPAWPEVFDAVRRLDAAAAAASAPTDNPSTRDRMAWLPSMTEDERATLTRQDALAPTDRED